jgi:SPP1 family predicted phage head-tail adaptor
MPYQRPRLSIAARNERITLQEAVHEDDGQGGQALVRWRTIAEPWAQVQALDERTKEAMAGQGLTARHSYHVVMPYRTDITASPTLRAIVRDTTMQIHSAEDDEGRRRRLVLYVGKTQ